MFLESQLIDFILVLLICIKNCFKFSEVRCHNKVCLLGKVALVTGGSTGIGYQMVLALLSRGCKVIVADKIVDEEIKQSMIKETKNRNIRFEYVDLASFKSVRQLTERVRQSEEKLDILVNNAGIVMGPKTPTEDGLNLVMEVNYFGGFLLTHLLVDLLKQSSSGRIMFTSSIASFMHRITMDNIDSNSIKTETGDFVNYCNSKFCLIVASDMFAEKLKKYNITSNCHHPGMAKTSITEHAEKYWSTLQEKIMKNIALIFMSLFVRTAELGAQTAIHLATANEMENVTGEYFYNNLPTPKPKAAADKVLCSLIWNLSEKIVKLKEEERLV